MKWHNYINNLTPHATFKLPARRDQLDAVNEMLGVELPDDLSEVLAESNGIQGEYDLDLIWKCERIVEDNLHFRNHREFPQLFMPFNSLLFFGDAGNGDQFALAIRGDGRIHTSDVFVWDHEDDSRRWAAPSLAKYLDWWLTGKISV